MTTQKMTREAAFELWHAGFPEDTDAFIDAYWNMRSAKEYARMLTVEDKPAAGLHVVPLTLRVRGQDLSGAMVAGVATQSSMRRRGYAGLLLRQSAQTLAQGGVQVLVLDPFRESFYEPYGYRTGSFYRDALLDEAKAAPLETTCDAHILDAIYRRAMQTKSGFVVRDQKQWAFRLKDASLDGAQAFVLEDRAYAIAKIEEDVVRVWEHAAADAQSDEALLKALCACFHLPAAYSVPARRGQSGTRHGAMYCPLALAKIVSQIPSAAQGEFHFLVHDAAWQTTYPLAWRCGEGKAELLLDVRDDAPAIDAGELFLLLLGALDARDLSLEQETTRQLFACYPPCETLLFEQY